MFHRSNFLPQGMRRQLCKRWHFQTKKWTWFGSNRWNLSLLPPRSQLTFGPPFLYISPKKAKFNENHPQNIYWPHLRCLWPQLIYIESQRKTPQVPVNLCSGQFCRHYLRSIGDAWSRYQTPTIWETGSSVHPDQHECLEANSDHPAPISKPNTGGILGHVLMRQTSPTYPYYAIKPRMCFCSDHSLVSDSGAILWIQESLWLSLSNHRSWMPY